MIIFFILVVVYAMIIVVSDNVRFFFKLFFDVNVELFLDVYVNVKLFMASVCIIVVVIIM